jgi:hypothetical protein
MVSVPPGSRARSERLPSPPGGVEVGGSVTVAREGTTVVLTPTGQLDEAGATDLLAAVAGALGTDPARIDIDLCAIVGFTPEGAACLVECRERCGALVDGLHFRTSRGPGRHALLMAFAASE